MPNRFANATNPIFILVKEGRVEEVETFMGVHPFILINMDSLDDAKCPVCNSLFYDKDYGARGTCEVCEFSGEYEENIMTEAKEMYRIASISYAEGEAGYIELLEAQRTLTQTRNEYVNVLYNYQTALAALVKEVGGELP